MYWFIVKQLCSDDKKNETQLQSIYSLGTKQLLLYIIIIVVAFLLSTYYNNYNIVYYYSNTIPLCITSLYTPTLLENSNDNTLLT